MATEGGRIQVGTSDDYLDTTLVVATDGDKLHREAVFLSDPENYANRQHVTSQGQAEVVNAGVPSPIGTNSSTTILTSGSTFTGTFELDVHPDVMVSCQTDQPGTLYFDFSVDGTNANTFPSNGFRVAAGIHEFHTAVKGPRYFRVRLVNDNTADQTYLRLYTYYGQYRQGNSPLNQSVGLDTDAIHVRPTSFQDEVRIGRRSGVEGYTKFGYRTALAAANGEEIVWAATAGYTPQINASTYNILYSSATDGAAVGAEGAKTLAITYLATDGNPVTAAHTLGNDGNDTTSFSGMGINRVAVSSTGTHDSNQADIHINETTGGTTQAVVPAKNSVTQQCIYHVGSNADAVAKFLWWNLIKPSAGGNPKVKIKGYVTNRLIETKFEVFRVDVDESVELTGEIVEPIGFNLSPGDILYFVADTDTDNTSINLRFSLNEYQRS